MSQITVAGTLLTPVMSATPLRGVIIEGHDGSGKSSFVSHLKAALPGGWDVLQLSHRSGDQFARYANTYAQADRLVLDRAHFSEIVYSELLRGVPAFDERERAELDLMAARHFALVLCTASPERVVARYEMREFEKRASSVAEVDRIQAKFIERLAPLATTIYESDRVGSLEITLRVVLDALNVSASCHCR